MLSGAITAALAVAACGSDTSGDGAASTEPDVVATTSIWADIVSNVACDGLAEVGTIVPIGGDPHTFEASLRDRETMESSALIVTNGLMLEASLTDLIDAVEQTGVPVVEAAAGVDTIPIGEHGGHDDDQADAEDDDENNDHENDDHDAHEHADGDADPHVWFDPQRVATTLPVIADALAEIGYDRDALDACVAAYTDTLSQLDADVAAIVATLPESERILVTNHDSLGYFADRYDFDVLGSVIPAASSQAETNPAELEELGQLIDQSGVAAIFAETQHSSSDAEALARRVGDVEVVTLLTGTLDAPGSDGDDYVGWLLENAQLIVDGLSGGD